MSYVSIIRMYNVSQCFSTYSETSGGDGERKDNLRSKPLSGILQVTVKGARELDHAPIVGRFRSASKQIVETHVSLKVEGTQLARSHPSRTDRWNEDFEITVDKANEVEIAVYDKQVGEQHAVPIGLLWIRISDLVEALRRQKVFMESGQGGWVTAGAMGSSGPSVQPNAADMNTPLTFGGAPGGGPSGFGPPATEGIDAWFAVEPAGAIALHLNFSEHKTTALDASSQFIQSRRTFASVPSMLLLAVSVGRVPFANAKARFTR